MNDEPKYQLNLTEAQLDILTTIVKIWIDPSEDFAALKKAIEERDLITLD